MDACNALAQLAQALPPDADISGIDFAVVGDEPLVTIRTTTPGKLVGRKGAVAEGLRAALSQVLGPTVRLNITEQRKPLAG